MLHLYHNDYGRDRALTLPRTVNDTKEPTHPRIRIRCGRDHTYRLELCPPNMLLDNDLRCV